MPANAKGSMSVAAKNASASSSSRSESGQGRLGAFKRCAGLVTALMARHCASRSSAKKLSGSCHRRMTSTLLFVVMGFCTAVRALGVAVRSKSFGGAGAGAACRPVTGIIRGRAMALESSPINHNA